MQREQNPYGKSMQWEQNPYGKSMQWEQNPYGKSTRSEAFRTAGSFPGSDRGRFLPLPDHRDASLISWHCHSMTVARRMSARASTAAALRAYRAKKRRHIIKCISGLSLTFICCFLSAHSTDISGITDSYWPKSIRSLANSPPLACSNLASRSETSSFFFSSPETS